jgi:hypothetical protein
MNYVRIYNNIIENRIKYPASGYTESHHIIPVCLGGANSKDNLVKLTAKEHFICHWILVKIYKGNKNSYHKMLKAFNMMCNTLSTNQQRYVISSRIFSKYREDFSSAMSSMQLGKNNSQAGTMWICNLISKENKKISNKIIPEGWIAGRNKWKIPNPRKLIIKKEKISKKYLQGYKVCVNGVNYDSISQAADCLSLKHETARRRFKSKNFTEYKILSGYSSSR